MASVQEQLDDIKTQLAKQSKIVAQTAQQVLSMQVAATKSQLNAVPSPADALADGKQTSIDTTNFATNEDLVQLVGELQGQLNLLEQKSVLRSANVNQKKDTDLVLALPNLDGEFPPGDDFPHTIAELKDLSDDVVITLCTFYQLLPAELEERARESEKEQDDQVPPAAQEYPPETVDMLFEDLASFLGVSHVKRGL